MGAPVEGVVHSKRKVGWGIWHETTVIRDLNFAGCVKSVSYVSRPEMPTVTHNAAGDVMHTDGSVAVVALQDCKPIDPQLVSNSTGGTFKAGNYPFRYIGGKSSPSGMTSGEPTSSMACTMSDGW